MAGAARAATVTLPADDQILISREFDAPRHLVYRAWTTPELVRRWWAGNRGQVTSIEIDLRVGGRWRYAMVADDGSEVAFHGEYREVIPGERIVFTEVSEARPAAEALTTVTFRDAGAGTAVAILVRYGSRLDRDTHYDHMQDGLQDALGLLEQTVSSLRNGQAPAAGRP